MKDFDGHVNHHAPDSLDEKMKDELPSVTDSPAENHENVMLSEIGNKVDRKDFDGHAGHHYSDTIKDVAAFELPTNTNMPATSHENVILSAPVDKIQKKMHDEGAGALTKNCVMDPVNMFDLGALLTSVPSES